MINKKEFDYLGITRWHELGYKGKGIKICSKENIIKGVFDDVFCMKSEEKDDWSIHATLVMDYIRQVAPEAEKMAIETSGTIKKVYGVKTLFSEQADYLRENTPDILTTSFFQPSWDNEEPIQKLYKELYDKGCFLCLGAGNKNAEIQSLANGDMWKAIGACNYSSGNPKRQLKYAEGEELDYMSFHKLVATYDNEAHSGTSFSSPLFAGMVALVQCFFKKHTGKKLDHEHLNQFIKDNCLDLEATGRDDKSGYGLFRLPEPTTIDIKKYCEDYSEKSEVVNMNTYNTLEEVPEWGKPTIEKLIKKGALKGDEAGNLYLSEDLLRTLVIHDRLGLYDTANATDTTICW